MGIKITPILNYLTTVVSTTAISTWTLSFTTVELSTFGNESVLTASPSVAVEPQEATKVTILKIKNNFFIFLI
jgi:hypothetical protein